MLTSTAAPVDIPTWRSIGTIANVHYVDKEEFEGMGDLQASMCLLLEEGVGLHHTCEDKVHKCKCRACLIACQSCNLLRVDFSLLLQTWKMLTNMLSFKEVVNYMYGTMRETAHLRNRCPQPANWTVAEVLAGELDYPCKVVIKAQDQGHWFLSDVVHMCVMLYKHMSDELDKLLQEEEATQEEDDTE